jgi:hypothetical protein
MSDQQKVDAPSDYILGQEIDWGAPWIEVNIWVELPFWLMVEDTAVPVGVGGHIFEVAIQESYFELHAGAISDSKQFVAYHGPFKRREALSEDIRSCMEMRPEVPFMWRKSKTVLKINSRCNENVWNMAQRCEFEHENSISWLRVANVVRYYLTELCRAHIPVVNSLVQGYRLATYDYFPYEISPWDVPFWLVERSGKCIQSWLVPYRQWDSKPVGFATPLQEWGRKFASGEKNDPPTLPYKLIDANDLRDQVSSVAAPGEFELLDSLNLMERGDYSGAVRRITTALEAIVEAEVGKAVKAADGTKNAAKFLRDTETNFRRRVTKYEELSGRTLPGALRTEMSETRKLRHSIVHRAYRIGPSERPRAQRAVDTGRWTFNWFENNKQRTEIREKKIAHRGLGRDRYGIFTTKITSDGVVVSMPSR